jgi:hypothetical protein
MQGELRYGQERRDAAREAHKYRVLAEEKF